MDKKQKVACLKLAKYLIEECPPEKFDMETGLDWHSGKKKFYNTKGQM